MLGWLVFEKASKPGLSPTQTHPPASGGQEALWVKAKEIFEKGGRKDCYGDQALILRTGKKEPCKELKKDVSSVGTPDEQQHPPLKNRSRKIASSPGERKMLG